MKGYYEQLTLWSQKELDALGESSFTTLVEVPVVGGSDPDETTQAQDEEESDYAQLSLLEMEAN